MTSSALNEFQDWLESRRWTRADERPFSIAIECGNRPACDQIASGIARYLSEVHAGSPNGWLYFGPDLVTAIAGDKTASDLSEAFPELVAKERKPCDGARCGLLSNLARIGGAVLSLTDACRSLRSHPDLFVVGLHHPESGPMERADLILDLDRIDPRTAVRVAADSALEWAAARQPATT